MLEQAKWIWVDQEAEKDTYGEFYSTFTYDSGEVILTLSADSNYAVYVNGTFVNSGQYPDFPHYKVYDKLDITSYCKRGDNHLAILVWYYGVKGTFTYYKGNAALCFELYKDGELCLQSSEAVFSRLSRTYQNGLTKMITGQVGYSFHYNATAEDGWMMGNLSGFEKSKVVEQDLHLYERPIEKLCIGERVLTKLVKQESNYYLYDLEREEVGYLTLRVKSDMAQKLTICFGEHIADGKVRRKIGPRDFSVEVTVRKGKTEYTNYFRRLGLRYLEVWSEEPITVDFLSVLPCYYPVNCLQKQYDNPLWQQIYDISVRTLQLCMHDHYEDCPWREQALYAMDSRNQMLCGYYAFKEYRFARESLYLMMKNQREDGLLSICAPCDSDLTIPSFTLHYFTQVYEYTKYSGDKTLIQEIFSGLQKIMDAFLSRMKDGLIPMFEEAQYWNFYEWTEGLDNGIRVVDEPLLETALNCLVSIALQNLQKICDELDVQAEYEKIAYCLNQRIREVFYNKESGLYVNRYGEEKYSELVNALAVLCGASKGAEAEYICEQLVNNHSITKTSLSMMCFKYDALLQVNKEKYRTFILTDIEKTYKKMLDAGATSFWETVLGEVDFDNAGSLCHGWSAMPIYYFDILMPECENHSSCKGAGKED